MTDTAAPWEHTGYSDIVAVGQVDRDVAVEFANGDIVRVPASNFGVHDDKFDVAMGPDTGLTIEIRAGGIATEVPWTQVRAATDPRFAQELRRRDTEQSRKLGVRLKALREDRNLNQRDLAAMVGMSAPQLSKIESGASDLRVSTLQSLLRAMNSDFEDVASPDALEVSQKTLRRRAEQAGVSREVMERIFAVVGRRNLLKTLSAAFGWSPDLAAAGTLTTPPPRVAVSFKARQGDTPHDSPLVNLALAVAHVVRSSEALPKIAIPSTAAAIRQEALSADGQVTLASLARWMWASGIAVVPLLGGKGFAAAVMSVDGAPVVVVKDSRPLAVFWLFDLAHELGHIVLGHLRGAALVDLDEPRPHSPGDADEEAASAFALDLLLPGHETLLAAVRTESRGSYLRFKGAVDSVATRAGVSSGLLGMVAAFELADIGESKDRWGSATNLARSDGEGRSILEEIAAEHLSTDGLSEIDAALVRATVFTNII